MKSLTVEALYEALGTAFETDGQDDTIRLKGLNFDDGRILLDVETFVGEMDMTARISVANGTIEVDLDGQCVTIEINEDLSTAEEWADVVLGNVSHLAEEVIEMFEPED